MFFDLDAYSPDGARVIDLADGRVLFMPSGRSGKVYQVGTYQDGRRLEKRLKLIERLAAILMVGVLFLSKTRGFWYLILAAPVLILPIAARRLLTVGLPEAHDYLAMRETDGGAAFGYEPEVSRFAENKPIHPR